MKDFVSLQLALGREILYKILTPSQLIRTVTEVMKMSHAKLPYGILSSLRKRISIIL